MVSPVYPAPQPALLSRLSLQGLKLEANSDQIKAHIGGKAGSRHTAGVTRDMESGLTSHERLVHSMLDESAREKTGRTYLRWTSP